mgnify:CR=1 FL=1
MKLRLTLFFVCLSAFLFTISGSALAEEKTTSGSAVDISAVSAVLIEGSTGDIIYEKDKDKELVPASITKIMTLTLIFEALDNGKLTLETPVSVSEYAASMGGSQVFLEPNETQTVDTMIKCISIASANDAAVAMAEKIAGSEEAFVKKMNEKAVALGMKHTQFKNCNIPCYAVGGGVPDAPEERINYRPFVGNCTVGRPAHWPPDEPSPKSHLSGSARGTTPHRLSPELPSKGSQYLTL